jgi:diacylglycerol O-acyltransferase / wax synthase
VAQRLDTQDAAWLLVESRETPMHVGSLLVFSPPAGSDATYLQGLAARLRGARSVAPPWSYKLAARPLGRLAPAWVEDDAIDLDYHFRHSALPRPGGERELGVLVSRLHSIPLDLERPLWECHLIEGLEGGRFALYTKMHHSLIDGVSAIRLVKRILASDAGAPWEVRPPPRAPRAPAPPFFSLLREQVTSLQGLGKALGRLAAATRRRQDLLPPFVGPRSALNGRVTGQRRFATARFDLARLRAAGRARGATLNDVVLYLCATALRRFLLESDALPRQPLTAGVPVSVRAADDQSTGTAISFLVANLATDEPDPRRRLAAIVASTRRAKEHLGALPRAALVQYTMLLMAPYMLQLASGLGGRMRPAFNITISNVPGPEEPIAFQGARLEAMYPLSLIAHGGALNITCVSYAGELCFGLTGCRDTLPHMQHLAVYTGDALAELENA